MNTATAHKQQQLVNLYRKPDNGFKAAAKVVFVIIVTLTLYIALRVVENLFVVKCEPSAELSDHECQRSRKANTIATAVLTFVRSVVIVAGILIALHHAGIRTSALFTLAGIFSLVLGLAAQNVLKDYFAGLVFLTEEQLYVGDHVHLIVNGIRGDGICSGISGVVENLSMRRIKLRNFDNDVLYVPNGTIQAVVNSSQNFPVVRLRVQVSRTAKIQDVLRITKATCEQLAADLEFSSNFPQIDRSAADVNKKRRLSISLETLGMDGPEPEVVGVSELRDSYYEVMVRFMVDLGRQWHASRLARNALIANLQAGLPEGAQLVTVVRLEDERTERTERA
jgi:small-conductance mechanosensitive channel